MDLSYFYKTVTVKVRITVAGLHHKAVGASITPHRLVGNSSTGRDIGAAGTGCGAGKAQCAVRRARALAPDFRLPGVDVADMQVGLQV